MRYAQDKNLNYKSTKGNNSKGTQGRVRVCVYCTSTTILRFIKFPINILELLSGQENSHRRTISNQCYIMNLQW